jgi:quercetin dioxygenase-like cupin family protein
MKRIHKPMRSLPSNQATRQGLPFARKQGISFRPHSELEDMQIKRSGAQPSAKGPAEYFTGSVRVDPLIEAPEPARVRAASVTFEPGARSAWHTHPLGQALVVTSGCGYVQSWGGPVRIIRPGDVVWCPPNEKHWHGAAPTTAMTHTALQEALNGRVVEWMEKVTDEQYLAGVSAEQGDVSY